MNLKPIFTSLLLLIHVICLAWYLYLGPKYMADHKYLHVLLLYAPALILPAINNSLRSNNDNKYQIYIYQSHNLFCLLVGTIYAMYYVGIFFTPRVQVVTGCFIFIILIILVFSNLWRYGFFKRK